LFWLTGLPQAGVVIVHEQLLIFLQHRFGHTLSNFDNHIILPFMPGIAETSADGLTAEDFESPFAKPIIVEFTKKCFLPKSL